MYLSIMLGFRTKFPYANTSIVEQNKLENSGFPCYNFPVFLLNYCLKMLKNPPSIITTHFISKVTILLVWSCLFNVCYAQSDDASASQVQLRVFLEGLIETRIPEMVRVEAGEFTIGTSDNNRLTDPPEPHHKLWDEGDIREEDSFEYPQQGVEIPRAFEVSKHEITRAQFKYFLDSNPSHNVGNCQDSADKNWQNPGFTQADDHPVVCVSWEDAQAYVEWFSELTEQPYRLLSEAEWEYAARAGMDTTYHFGNMITKEQANYDSDNTVPVGSLDSANDFGLHDVHGNVWEWVADCWHHGYGETSVRIPDDGSAWSTGCEEEDDRMLRGGAWDSDALLLRSAQRGVSDKGKSYSNVGFRIARTIPLIITGPAQNTPDTPIGIVEGDMTEVEVTIEELSMQTTITITLLVENSGVVSTTPTSITIGPSSDDSMDRSAKFMLTAQGLGETIVTLRVRDSSGNTDEIKIHVVVEPPYPEMVRVPKSPLSAGSFTMGVPEAEKGLVERFSPGYTGKEEEPQHEVNIPYAFEVSQYEVTRRQFAAFVEASSSHGHDVGKCNNSTSDDWEDPGFTQTDNHDNHPVVCVSWVDAKEYVKWLSDETGHSYRLLTEAEWEYAARAGTTSTYYFGDINSIILPVVNAKFSGTGNVPATQPVGLFKPNEWGLYDVHGNAYEWVEDCWHANYEGAPLDGSAWTTNCTNDNRVIRGGSWEDNRFPLRSAARASASAVETNRPRDYGFRVALTPLSITSFMPAILLHAGGDIRPTTQVEVSIKEIYTEETVTMTLELDDDGDAVVSISTNSITILPSDGSIDRSAAFTLRTTGRAGNTTVTLVVTDGMGYGDEVKIPVVVIPIYPEMVRVLSGKFTMGAPSDEAFSETNERLQREVNINYVFKVGKYEVTRGQFAAFVNDSSNVNDSSKYVKEPCFRKQNNNWQNPDWDLEVDFTQTDDHPVVCVSWNNAQAYAKWLSGKTGHNYRLLTEAEWEYAARAGTTTAYHFGKATTNISEYARYDSNSVDNYGTIAVGSLKPNNWGLHDVHGNVWEWVEDCWQSAGYKGAPSDGSARKVCDTSTQIVRRGGSWSNDFDQLRSANRAFGQQHRQDSINVNGFRVAFTPLRITTKPPDRVELNITKQSGEDTFFDKQLLEVNIEETYTDEPVEVSLQLDEGGGDVVYISTSSVTISTRTSITIILPSNGEKDRTAEFTLTARDAGNTTATLVAKDNLGNMHTVKIPVVVEEIETALTRLENDQFFQRVRVPPGTFMMGSREDTGENDERPQHEVTIPYAFEVGKYEVTRGQYETFSEASDHVTPACDQLQGTWQKLNRLAQTNNHPVVCVGWDDAQAYVAWLNTETDAEETGREFRLLSEEEWEYAARAGTTSTYYFGDTIGMDQANFNNRGGGLNPTNNQVTKPVGSYGNERANAFELHDIHGNVWEWVEDCYRVGYNHKITTTDDDKIISELNGMAFTPPFSCTARILRGGSWNDGDAQLRSANRFSKSGTFRQDSYGFRIARTIPLQIINYPSEEIDLRVGGGRLATTQVEVVIQKIDTNKPVKVELQLDDDSIVSTGSITLLSSDNNVQRTAKFTLSVESKGNTTLTVVVMDEGGNEEEIELRLAAIGGNTTLTVVVTDDAGNEDKIKIRLAVAPSLKIVSQTSDEVNLVVRGRHLATTQVEVVIQKIPTEEPVTVSLQLDKEGESAVSGSMSSITLPSDDNEQRTAKFTLSVESKGNTTLADSDGNTMLADSGGNTTLTVVVMDEGGNKEEIELRLAAIGGNTTLTVVVTDKDGNKEEIEIRVVVEAFLPEMVRVPPMGNPEKFSMGSESTDDERPVHDVTISKPFEVGKYEVTRRQFAVFVEVTQTKKADVGNCGTEVSWENPGFTQDNDHPVVCVSRYTAQKYVEWLSDLTGQSYRLLTEAEWEYAARARTTTPYHFKPTPFTGVEWEGHANVRVGNIRPSSTKPVGFYGDARANDFELYDVHGNAGEWVEDCWHNSYEVSGMKAPDDGSAWTTNCTPASQKVWRGGSWKTEVDKSRSASRARSSSSDSALSTPPSRHGYNNIGFRVARTIP